MGEFTGIFESFELDIAFTSLTRHYVALKFDLTVAWTKLLVEKYVDEVWLPFVDLVPVGMARGGKFGLKNCVRCRGVPRVSPYAYHCQHELVRIGPLNNYDMPSSLLWENYVGAYRCIQPACQRMYLFVNVKDAKEYRRRFRKDVLFSLQFMLPFPTELYAVNRTLGEIDSGVARPEELRFRTTNVFRIRHNVVDFL